MGKTAMPPLLAKIKMSSPPRQWMEVAVSVWMMINQDQAPMGVGALKQEAYNTQDLAARQRLDWAAYQAARDWCSETDKAQCKAAAFEGRNSPDPRPVGPKPNSSGSLE
jgi:hypothetical protein